LLVTRRRLSTLMLILLLVGVLNGCGPTVRQSTPLATVLRQDQVDAGHYRLQPGDQIEVHHIIDPDYSAVVVVAPDGRISVPGIKQPVDAGGYTIDSLAETLNRLYYQNDTLKDPFFSLNLRSFGSLQVFIGGEVQRPGYLELSGGNRSLLQVIMAGGGFLNTARRKEVVVIRTLPDGHNELFTADLANVLNGTDLSQNIRIHPLDVVYVPKSDVASLDTWVDQYIRQALPLSTSASFTLTNQNSSTGR
jgi:protein involved in polysaccharide export with SLBB domain